MTVGWQLCPETPAQSYHDIVHFIYLFREYCRPMQKGHRYNRRVN